MSGYKRLHASLWDSTDFADEPFSEREAFMWLVAKAAWKAHERRVGRHVVAVKRGEFVGTTRGIAKTWKWSEARVRRYFDRLTERRTLRRTADAHATRITICNYDEFQGASEAGAGEATHSATHINKMGLNRMNKDTPPLSPSAAPKRKTQIPEDWIIPDRGRAYATDRGLDDAEIDNLRDDFIAHHRGTGEKRPGWDRSWQTWVRNHVEWSTQRSQARSRPGKPGKSSGGAYVEAFERQYGAGVSSGSDGSADDGTVASALGNIPDSGQPASCQGGVVVELFRGTGGEDVRGHVGDAWGEQRGQGQRGTASAGVRQGAVAIPGGGGGGCSRRMAGHPEMATGVGGSETTGGQGPGIPQGSHRSNGAQE